MRSVFALAGLVAVAFAGKTVTQTAVVDVTVTSCEAAPTDCYNEWEETSVPVDPTSTATYWGDVPVAASSATTYWSDAPVPTSTPVAPAVGASTWLEVPVPVASTSVKPVASYTKPAAVATYTGGAAAMAGSGLAGVAAIAAMLL